MNEKDTHSPLLHNACDIWYIQHNHNN